MTKQELQRDFTDTHFEDEILRLNAMLKFEGKEIAKLATTGKMAHRMANQHHLVRTYEIRLKQFETMQHTLKNSKPESMDCLQFIQVERDRVRGMVNKAAERGEQRGYNQVIDSLTALIQKLESIKK